MDLAFEEMYERWHRRYAVESGKDRRNRMKDRYGAVEEAFVRYVWFPLFESLEELSPQATAIDAEGEYRILDFAWVWGELMLNVEMDRGEPQGKLSHLRERRRDLNLQAAGWHIVRFAEDDVLRRPERCRRMLRAWMNRWIGASRRVRDARQDCVLRFALACGGTVRFRDVVQYLQVSDKTALAILRGLVDQGILAVDGGKKRVHKYHVHTRAVKQYYWGDP